MSQPSKADVIAYLSALGPAEVEDLILELEELWGLERLAVQQPWAVDMGVPVDMGADLVLRDAGENRIAVMKVLRECFGLGLREAKSLVDRAGELVVASDLHGLEIEELAGKIRAAGAVVEVRW